MFKKKNIMILVSMFWIIILLAGCSNTWNLWNDVDSSNDLKIQEWTGRMLRNWGRWWRFGSGNMGNLPPEEFRWTWDRLEMYQWWPNWSWKIDRELFMSWVNRYPENMRWDEPTNIEKEE